MHKLKILIVEDEILIAEYIKIILVKNDYDVLPFSVTGKKAIHNVEVYKPDLVLMDIKLKGKMDGIEALQAIKKDPRTKDLPVIMLTGKSEDEDLLKGYKFGADYYITKPFKIRTLLSGIRMMIQPPSGPTQYRI